MDLKQYRLLIVSGSVVGAVCVLAFASLASAVLASNPAMTPRITLVAVSVVLLGNLSITLVAGAWVTRMLVEYGKQRWWRGYAACVEDFKGTGGEVVRIPATRNGRG